MDALKCNDNPERTMHGALRIKETATCTALFSNIASITTINIISITTIVVIEVKSLTECSVSIG